MATEGGRGRRVLIGCLGGCVALFLLAIGSCVAVTVWVNTPGDVLDPQIVFDPEAAGYVEWQLRIEDPGTEAIVDAFSRMTNREDDLPQNELLQTLLRFNQRRQERELRQLFPAAAAWVPYAGDVTGEPGDLYTVSIAKAVNQTRIADWIFARVATFADDMPTVRYNGELLLSVGDGDGEFHGFLHPLGAFWSNRLEVAQRAVDALAAAPGSSPRSLLQSELTALEGPGAIRGVLTNPEGLLIDRLGGFTDGEIDPDIEIALGSVELLTLVGGPMEGGDVRLAIDLRVEESRRPEVDAAVRRLVEDLQSGRLPIQADVETTARGVSVDLLLEDLPGVLDDFGREVTRTIEEEIEGAAERRSQEIEDATRDPESPRSEDRQ